ncbi:MAG TPA: hypothetical protein VI078_02370 [bacterium]
MKNVFSVILLCALFPTSAIADTTWDFTLPSGVRVSIAEAPFQEANFQVEGCAAGDSQCRINGHLPFGEAFGLPKTYVKSIQVSFHEQSYALDASDMYNAWGNRLLQYPGAVRYFGGKCFDVKNCQFRGLFSDAAGSFVAEWLVVDGHVFRTVLSGSNDIVDLFSQHIDPPEFD